MAGDEPLCAKASLSGYTVDGTFQQYAIGKAAHVARIPEGVPLDGVAPILCAGIPVCSSSPPPPFLPPSLRDFSVGAELN